ncbi:MAG: hypothetical protein HFG26_05360 [Provencibacterium sp.]|jgi:menaquinone-dependent protoporphyrinogen IX oxidase|nr:hypothetical protein [Provencibacterium sp.]
MNPIILFGSRYGTTERYARLLAQRTGLAAFPYKEARSLEGYDALLYLGGLYAGGVLGLSKTAGRLREGQLKGLAVITVGLADPKNAENVQNIRSSIRRQLPAALYERAEFFHLRGGVNYAKLSFTHRTMMGLLYRQAKSIPPPKRDAETQALLESWGGQADFFDAASLEPVLACGLLNGLAAGK